MCKVWILVFMFKLYGVLGAITSCNLKFGQIKILLYSYQINKYLQKLIGAFHISIMQDVQILFKCLLLFLILPFYWYPVGRLRKQKTSLTYPWSKMSAWWPEGWNNYLWWPCRSQCQSSEPQGSRIKAWRLAWAQTTAWGSLLLFDAAALCWESCFFGSKATVCV